MLPWDDKGVNLHFICNLDVRVVVALCGLGFEGHFGPLGGGMEHIGMEWFMWALVHCGWVWEGRSVSLSAFKLGRQRHYKSVGLPSGDLFIVTSHLSHARHLCSGGYWCQSELSCE